MKLVLRDAIGLFKIFIGALASFLILFGIHWIVILAGIALGIFYFAIPKRYFH